MFKMTHDVKVEGYKPFKCNSMQWTRSIDNCIDTAKLKLPGICKFKGGERVITGMQFKEGMKVTIYAGYDNKNDMRFMGFIKRINFNSPLEIECEGYSYQLRKKSINKSFLNTTIREILQFITEGTDIKLADNIPAIPIPKVLFKNYNGLQVLEYMKEKCLLTAYFDFNTLYVGLRGGLQKPEIKFQLRWNVIKDSELVFNTNTTIINILLDGREQNGEQNRQKAKTIKAGNEKIVKLFLITDPVWRQKIAEDVQAKINNRGYSGSITAFLHPLAEPGMSAKIIDTRYKERNGSYFIESVEGSFAPSGGRQKIGIGFRLQV